MADSTQGTFLPQGSREGETPSGTAVSNTPLAADDDLEVSPLTNVQAGKAPVSKAGSRNLQLGSEADEQTRIQEDQTQDGVTPANGAPAAHSSFHPRRGRSSVPRQKVTTMLRARLPTQCRSRLADPSRPGGVRATERITRGAAKRRGRQRRSSERTHFGDATSRESGRFSRRAPAAYRRPPSGQFVPASPCSLHSARRRGCQRHRCEHQQQRGRVRGPR